MRTTVGCRLHLEVQEPTRATLAIAVAGQPVTEQLSVLADGLVLPVQVLLAHHGTRLHLVELPVGLSTVSYAADIDSAHLPPEVTELDAQEALRPSRYCPSDLLGQYALTELGGATPDEVADWVFERLTYDGSASRPVDSALDTLLTGRGVCRDYAHLVITILRALDVPARLVSVYAPGLYPMDFHAVAEVAVDGRWQLLDATKLAPRSTMQPIATGRDAADTAFLAVTGGQATLTATEIWASTDRPLPAA